MTYPMGLDSPQRPVVASSTFRLASYRVSAVVADEENHRVLQHFLLLQCSHHASKRFVRRSHHGGIHPPDLVVYDTLVLLVDALRGFERNVDVMVGVVYEKRFLGVMALHDPLELVSVYVGAVGVVESLGEWVERVARRVVEQVNELAVLLVSAVVPWLPPEGHISVRCNVGGMRFSALREPECSVEAPLVREIRRFEKAEVPLRGVHGSERIAVI